MQTVIKVGNCTHRSAWTLVVLLQFSAIALVIASVFVPVWATTTNTQLGLYQCSSPCSKANYRDQKSIVCSQARFSASFPSLDITNTLNSGCQMFTGMEKAQYAYAIGAGAAVAFTGIWMISIWVFCSRKDVYSLGIWLGLLAFLSQSAAVAFWVIESNTLIYSCTDFPTDGTAPQMCLDIGGKLAIAAALMYGGINILYCIFGSIMKRNMGVSNNFKLVDNKSNGSIIADGSTIAIKSAWND